MCSAAADCAGGGGKSGGADGGASLPCWRDTELAFTVSYIEANETRSPEASTTLHEGSTLTTSPLHQTVTTSPENGRALVASFVASPSAWHVGACSDVVGELHVLEDGADLVDERDDVSSRAAARPPPSCVHRSEAKRANLSRVQIHGRQAHELPGALLSSQCGCRDRPRSSASPTSTRTPGHPRQPATGGPRRLGPLDPRPAAGQANPPHGRRNLWRPRNRAAVALDAGTRDLAADRHATEAAPPRAPSASMVAAARRRPEVLCEPRRAVPRRPAVATRTATRTAPRTAPRTARDAAADAPTCAAQSGGRTCAAQDGGRSAERPGAGDATANIWRLAVVHRRMGG